MKLTIIAVLITATSIAIAQTSTASLSGIVIDQQDGAIASATVTLTDPVRGTRSHRLRPALTKLQVDQPGFQRARLTGLVLIANDQRSVRVRINVATRDETIVVTEEAPLVRESPAVATSLDRRFIENQPLNGRSFQSLIQLAPGVLVSMRQLWVACLHITV